MRKIHIPETETKIIRKALKMLEDALVDVPFAEHLLYDVVTLKNLMNLPVTITVPTEIDENPHPALDVDLPTYGTDYLMQFGETFKFKNMDIMNEFIARIRENEVTYNIDCTGKSRDVRVFADVKDMDDIQKIYDDVTSKDVSEAQRLRFIADDIKSLVKFIKDKRLDAIFELQDDLGATGWNYVSNIEVACDLNDDEPKNWKK
jgi:DNA-binding Lrp family transcriptional regulator